jgi:hypothetical protein
MRFSITISSSVPQKTSSAGGETRVEGHATVHDQAGAGGIVGMLGYRPQHRPTDILHLTDASAENWFHWSAIDFRQGWVGTGWKSHYSFF